jgi:hypothetical protein
MTKQPPVQRDLRPPLDLILSLQIRIRCTATNSNDDNCLTDDDSHLTDDQFHFYFSFFGKNAFGCISCKFSAFLFLFFSVFL